MRMFLGVCNRCHAAKEIMAPNEKHAMSYWINAHDGRHRAWMDVESRPDNQHGILTTMQGGAYRPCTCNQCQEAH